jgi:hypothetical protein
VRWLSGQASLLMANPVRLPLRSIIAVSCCRVVMRQGELLLRNELRWHQMGIQHSVLAFSALEPGFQLAGASLAHSGIANDLHVGAKKAHADWPEGFKQRDNWIC